MSDLSTARLDILVGSAQTVEAERQGIEALSALLGVQVSAWPPELYDDQAHLYTLGKLRQDPSGARWWAPHYVVLRDKRALVGMVGFKGPPVEGAVELGYSILSEHQRQGIAPEAVSCLVDWALRQPGVSIIRAHTLPDHRPSIRVLHKCGFRLVGPGLEEGAILFELDRDPVLSTTRRP